MGEEGPKTFDREQFMTQATGWLLEGELLSSSYMKNALILNTYKVSPYINDVQMLIDQNDGKMLVLLGLTGFGKMFKKRAVASDVLDMLQSALPNYKFRVIFDKALFDKAIALGEKKAGLIRKELEERAAAAQAKKDAELKAIAVPPPVVPTEEKPSA